MLWLMKAKETDDGYFLFKTEIVTQISPTALLFPIEKEEGSFVEVEDELCLVIRKDIEQLIARRAKEVLDPLIKASAERETSKLQGRGNCSSTKEKEKDEGEDCLIERIIAKRKPHKSKGQSRFLVEWKQETGEKPSWMLSRDLSPYWQVLCKTKDWQAINEDYILTNSPSSKTLIKDLRRAYQRKTKLVMGDSTAKKKRRRTNPPRTPNNDNNVNTDNNHNRPRSVERAVCNSPSKASPALVAEMQKVMAPCPYPSPTSERQRATSLAASDSFYQSLPPQPFATTTPNAPFFTDSSSSEVSIHSILDSLLADLDIPLPPHYTTTTTTTTSTLNNIISNNNHNIMKNSQQQLQSSSSGEHHSPPPTQENPIDLDQIPSRQRVNSQSTVSRASIIKTSNGYVMLYHTLSYVQYILFLGTDQCICGSLSQVTTL